jgi:uncharacterized protein
MFPDIVQAIATELQIKPDRVKNALDLLLEGATIPFIARYRKEKTGSLDEIQLRQVNDRYSYLTQLQERKQTILDSIAGQNKLTDELRITITACTSKTELEDLYLPYKPKRRTRGTIAREKGLEKLARTIQSVNRPDTKGIDLPKEAQKYVSIEKGVTDATDALAGAADIIAEEIADKAELRSTLRNYLFKEGVFASKVKKDYPEGSTKYEMYRNFQAPVRRIAAHNLLALFRGENEGILSVDIVYDEGAVIGAIESRESRSRDKNLREFYTKTIKDAFKRLIEPSLIREIRADKKEQADLESIQTFEVNVRELLLSPPAGMKPTLAIDPGFRTGCKIAILSETGKFLEHRTIYPHTGEGKRQEAEKVVRELLAKYRIELIAIGNGTASRETQQFITEILKSIDRKPTVVIVNEAGASVYSASEVAREEFPDLDVTIRGAIAIGRRLQDPLAELVKVDPKSIGVGQYQHDVDQKLLKKKLDETVESCVNYVGVNLNTASKELLSFVSGITPSVALNIITYRDSNGEFKNRKQLRKVPKLGAKAFEQCAGFLRVRGGEEPLDNTAVHPESYFIAREILDTLQIPLEKISQQSSKVKSLDLRQFVTDSIGLPTLQDVIAELEKPGRDPREEFRYATFQEGINEISDLKEGMILEGSVTNVVNFGAFVDIGVHQDGLIHISHLANHFVSDPKQVVKVGQVVKVKVIEVNEKLKRIALSMKEV